MQSCEQFHSSSSCPISVGGFTVRSSCHYFHVASVHPASVGNKEKLDATRSGQEFWVWFLVTAGFPVSSISLHDIILSWLGLVKCLGENWWKGCYVLVWSCAQSPLSVHTWKWKNSLAWMQHSWHVIIVCAHCSFLYRQPVCSRTSVWGMQADHSLSSVCPAMKHTCRLLYLRYSRPWRMLGKYLVLPSSTC